MAKLNIPDEYRLGVSKIRNLDEQDVRNIRQALDGSIDGTVPAEGSINVKPRDVALTAVRSTSRENPADLKIIAEAIAALYGYKSFREISVEEFADNVCDAMEGLADEELRLPRSERAEFKRKLIILLGSEVLSIASKVRDLATEDERTFCHARIITDLRPVFGSKLEDGPKAVVVVHLLKLSYHQGSDKHQHFYVSMDAEDLQTMKKLIDRAQDKARSLKSSVRDMPVLGVPKESK
jgi:hypothetical protein